MAERELYETAITERIDELQRERVAILEEVAGPADLDLLLHRRFALGIGPEVGAILQRVVDEPGSRLRPPRRPGGCCGNRSTLSPFP